jgi:putative peptidoglycan lipid II flippase
VFVLSVANVVFPALSKHTALGDEAAYRLTLHSTLRSLFLFLLPMTGGLMALSAPLVRLVHRGGLFGDTAVAVTGNALFYFSMGIVGYGLQTVLSRACYARRDGRTPLIASLFAIGLNAALCFWLVRAPFAGYAAGWAALASSVSISASAALMLAVLVKRGDFALSGALARDLGKMGLLTAVTTGVALFALGLFESHTLLAVAVPAAVGAAVYGGGAFLLKLVAPGEVRRFFKK